ncbi:MAG TPA: hypothetical protein VHI51_19380 [Ktedonobacterales bacterium]|nr:hypothetical protein [Ktedonobacterales bacterium]
MDDLKAMSRSAARDASDAVVHDGAGDTCHEKACALPATTTCDRCGQRFCATHCGEFVLQRRDDPSTRPAHWGMLERLPTHAESYTLCAPCRTKPVPRNVPPLSAPPSVLQGGALGAHDREVLNWWAGVSTLDDLDV